MAGYFNVTYSSEKLVLCRFYWLSFVHRSHHSAYPLILCISHSSSFSHCSESEASTASHSFCFISFHSMIACSGSNRIALPIRVSLSLSAFTYFSSFRFIFILSTYFAPLHAAPEINPSRLFRTIMVNNSTISLFCIYAVTKKFFLGS